MSRLDHEALIASVAEAVGASADASGAADLVFDKGSIVVAASGDDPVCIVLNKNSNSQQVSMF